MRISDWSSDVCSSDLTAPNVVQGRAKVRYTVRATDLPGMMALIERVKKIAQGAALMTETTVEHQVISAVSNLLGNTPLEEAMQVAMDTLGGVAFEIGGASWRERGGQYV